MDKYMKDSAIEFGKDQVSSGTEDLMKPDEQ